MSLFARGERLYTNASVAEDYPMMRTIVLALGKESLTEAGEWLKLQRSRPIEVPRV